jgi:ATP adenylyltransferase
LSRRLVPGGWAARLRDCSESAAACGALHSLASEVHVVAEGGVSLVVRVLARLDLKERATADQSGRGTNPFLPYDDALYVGDVSDTHVALLNKYNVVPHHLLLVTRAFHSQDEPLSAADFAALWAGLAEIDGLGFYNGGAVAGASQPHKHLQIVPGPLGPGTDAAPVPIEPILTASVPEEGIGRCPTLPFPHALASTAALARLDPEAAGAASVEWMERLRGAAGDAAPGYNLLVTRRFALYVPRAVERWDGVSVNALGFAGSLLVRDREGLARIRQAGPLAVLAHVATGGGRDLPAADRR